MTEIAKQTIVDFSYLLLFIHEFLILLWTNFKYTYIYIYMLVSILNL